MAKRERSELKREWRISGVQSEGTRTTAYLLGDNYRAIHVPHTVEQDHDFAQEVCDLLNEAEAARKAKAAPKASSSLTPETPQRFGSVFEGENGEIEKPCFSMISKSEFEAAKRSANAGYLVGRHFVLTEDKYLLGGKDGCYVCSDGPVEDAVWSYVIRTKPTHWIF